MTAPSSWSRTHANHVFCGWGVLLLLGILAYGLSLDGPLFFDDQPNLTDNRFVQIDGTRFDDWRAASLSSQAGMTRRPVAMLTFAANHALFGDFSSVHLKAINLFIHCVIGLLIYSLAVALFSCPALEHSRLLDTRLLALLAAAIWFLHPLHVSTVLYAVQRMAQLSTLFVVAGLLVFCRYRLRWAQRGAAAGEVLGAALWLLLLTILATFSKENGALLPWLILVVEVTLFRGVWQQGRSPALKRAGWLLFVAPLLCLALLLLFSPEAIIGRYAGREFSVEERLFTQGRVLWHYVYWLALPDINAMGFQHDDIKLSRSLFRPYTTWLALLGWLTLLLGSWWLRRSFPLLLFAVLFYLVGHAMESTVYPLEMVYEHRNYLPAIGFAILLAGVLAWIVNAVSQLGLGVAGLGVLAILLALLFIRSHTWSDDILLSRVNVENHPDSPRSHFFYGNALFKRYQRRQELQLSEKEELELAVVSRYHFEKMHEIDGRDVAPIVMLYQIDSMLFASMPDRVDWLQKLSVLLQSRRLQASDYSALSGLVNHFSHDVSAADRDRFASMLDTLIERYPGRTSLVIFKYRLQSSAEQVSPEELLQLLTHAERINPRHLEIYPAQIIEYNRTSDWAAIHETAREWMRQDQSRLQLPAIRSIFEQQ